MDLKRPAFDPLRLDNSSSGRQHPHQLARIADDDNDDRRPESPCAPQPGDDDEPLRYERTNPGTPSEVLDALAASHSLVSPDSNILDSSSSVTDSSVTSPSRQGTLESLSTFPGSECSSHLAALTARGGTSMRIDVRAGLRSQSDSPASRGPSWDSTFLQEVWTCLHTGCGRTIRSFSDVQKHAFKPLQATPPMLPHCAFRCDMLAYEARESPKREASWGGDKPKGELSEFDIAGDVRQGMAGRCVTSYTLNLADGNLEISVCWQCGEDAGSLDDLIIHGQDARHLPFRCLNGYCILQSSCRWPSPQPLKEHKNIEHARTFLG